MTSNLKTLRYYFYAGFVEGLLAFVILLLIPSDPKNAWLFGLSKSRLAMAAGILAVALVFGWLGRSFGKKEDHVTFAQRVTHFAGNFPVYGPVILTFYGIVIFGAYLNLIIAFQPLSTLQGVLLRILPVMVYLFTRLVQTIMVWIILARQVSRESAIDGQLLIQITPSKVTIILAGIALFLILASFTLDTIESLTWAQKYWGFRVKFDLDQEANIPTYFSSFILLISATLFTLIGLMKRRTKGQFAQHWVGLGMIFLFMSLDETAVLHEKFIPIFKEWLHPQGIFFFGWVILALPLVAITALIYLRFFLHLPTKYKILIFISIAVYLTGVLGTEMIGGWFAEYIGESNPFYNVLTTFEESLEPIGIITLIYTLLQYLRENFEIVKIQVTNRF